MGLPLNSTACAMCGQCTVVCPTGALKETDGLAPVWLSLIHILSLEALIMTWSEKESRSVLMALSVRVPICLLYTSRCV